MPLRQLFRDAGAVVPPKPAKPSPILRHAVGSAVPAPRRPVSAIPAQGNTDCPPKDRGNQRPRECCKRERAGSRREAPYSAARWRTLSRASIPRSIACRREWRFVSSRHAYREFESAPDNGDEGSAEAVSRERGLG